MPSKRLSILFLTGTIALYGLAAPLSAWTADKTMDEISATTNEGIRLLKQGRPVEGERLLSKALIMAETANPNDPRLPGMMSNLALSYADQGKSDQAEDLFKKAIAFFEKQHAKPEIRAKTEDNLGQLYLKENKVELAGKHLLAARQLFKEAGVLSSPPAAMNLDNLSRYYKAIGNLPEAVSMCQEALSLMQKEMGSNNSDVAVTLLNLADLQRAQKNNSESDKLYKQASVVIERTFSPENPQALRSFAQMLSTANRPLEAAHLLSLADDIDKGVVSKPATAKKDAKSQTEAMTQSSKQPKDITSENDFEQWCTYYYLHPQPDLTVKALLFAEKNGYFDKESARAPFLAMISQLFRQNPKLLPVWIKELTPMATVHKKLIWNALWLANTPESKEEANLFAKQFPAYDHPPAQIASIPAPQPIEKMQLSADVLDMLWGSFFITGDEKYVDRIISALPGLRKGEHDPNKMMAAGAAQWSLTANAHQHQRVMKICMAARQKHPECKPEVDQVIARANARQK